jgi:hypothetical protein
MLLIVILQTGVKRQADGVGGVSLGFREITLLESEPPVIRVEMDRRVMQLHTDASCSEPDENLTMMLRAGFVEPDHRQVES